MKERHFGGVFSSSDIFKAMKYDVLFVDWDGTLSKSRFWGHWASWPTHSSRYEALQAKFFQGPDNVLHDWMRGRLTVEQAIEVASARTGIAAPELSEGIEASCKRMEFLDSRLPGLLMEARSRGLKVVIATDNMDTFTRWTAPALQLDKLCDHILNSHALHALKRDRDLDGTSKFFSGYLDDYGISPHRAALLDDRVGNQVVEEFGIDYLHVTSQYSAAAALIDLLHPY